jgi:hypothetical protein
MSQLPILILLVMLTGCSGGGGGGGAAFAPPSSSSKAITAFSFPDLGATGTVDESAKTISIILPDGTDVTNLVATFSSTGARVRVNGIDQKSGVTQNDFTGAIVYTVIAADGSSTTYTVTVTVALRGITAFSLLGIPGVIDETTKTISVTVPSGTDVSALVATFTMNGTKVQVNGIDQTSGVTPNDFTTPVVYTVTAAGGITTSYTVAVHISLSSAKAITAFSFTSPAATGIIDESAKTISVILPSGTNIGLLNGLRAVFIATGSVSVNNTVQMSGASPNDFTGPVVYTVTAEDSSTATYTVIVTIAPDDAKAITAFSFTSPAATGIIDESAKTISMTVPSGTDVTHLVAIFLTTGASVKIGPTVQVSGATPNDFTAPVLYTVTAVDTTTATYTVTVTVASSSSKAITAFSLHGISGVIDETAKTISIVMPYGTAVTALKATFTSTGASVKIGPTVQVSGVTPNDFTNPVLYTVTATDSSTETYTVTVVFTSPIAWQATSGAHLGSGSGGGTPLVFTHTTSSGSNKILIVSAMLRNNVAGLITTATYNGHQLSLIREISQSSAERLKVWYMLEPPVGTYNVVIKYTGSHTGLDGAASTYAGVSQNRPYSSSTATGASNSVTATVTVPSAPGELVVDALGYHNGGSIAPQTGQILRYKQSYPNQSVGVSDNKGASSVTMSWTLQNPDTWAMIAVSLRPAVSPTVRTVTVKPSGGDYHALQDALTGEAAKGANLVARNEELDIVCYSMEDTAKINIPAAFVTDPDHFIKISTPSSERHQGTWNGSKYRLEITATKEAGETYPSCIWLKGRHIWFDGIQVKCSANCSNWPTIFSIDPLPLSAVTMRFSNNILVGNFTSAPLPTDTNGWSNRAAVAPPDALFYVWNTEVRDLACQLAVPAGGRMVYVGPRGSSESWFIDNITVYNATRVLASNYSTVLFHVRNSIAAGLLSGGSSWTAYRGATSESDYNASNLTETLVGGHSVSNVTPLFVNTDSRDLRLQASDSVAKDSGVDTLNNPMLNNGLDGKGSPRNDGYWDIGAYEFP